MNENIVKFLKDNFKYIVIILVGIILLAFPSFDKGDSINEVENKLKATLETVEGVGDIDVMITFNSNNIAEGAIIVAEGASVPTVKKMLHDATVSVLNLPEYKVQVLTKKK